MNKLLTGLEKIENNYQKAVELKSSYKDIEKLIEAKNLAAATLLVDFVTSSKFGVHLNLFTPTEEGGMYTAGYAKLEEQKAEIKERMESLLVKPASVENGSQLNNAENVNELITITPEELTGTERQDYLLAEKQLKDLEQFVVYTNNIMSAGNNTRLANLAMSASEINNEIVEAMREKQPLTVALNDILGKQGNRKVVKAIVEAEREGKPQLTISDVRGLFPNIQASDLQIQADIDRVREAFDTVTENLGIDLTDKSLQNVFEFGMKPLETMLDEIQTFNKVLGKEFLPFLVENNLDTLIDSNTTLRRLVQGLIGENMSVYENIIHDFVENGATPKAVTSRLEEVIAEIYSITQGSDNILPGSEEFDEIKEILNSLGKVVQRNNMEIAGTIPNVSRASTKQLTQEFTEVDLLKAFKQYFKVNENPATFEGFAQAIESVVQPHMLIKRTYWEAVEDKLEAAQTGKLDRIFDFNKGGGKHTSIGQVRRRSDKELQNIEKAYLALTDNYEKSFTQLKNNKENNRETLISYLRKMLTMSAARDLNAGDRDLENANETITHLLEVITKDVEIFDTTPFAEASVKRNALTNEIERVVRRGKYRKLTPLEVTSRIPSGEVSKYSGDALESFVVHPSTTLNKTIESITNRIAAIKEEFKVRGILDESMYTTEDNEKVASAYHMIPKSLQKE